MTKVLIAHISETPLAGAPIRIVNALNQHTHLEARLINLNSTCYGARTFPEDLVWDKDLKIAKEVISKADIIHFHHIVDLQKNSFGIDFRELAKPDCKFIQQSHSEKFFYKTKIKTLFINNFPQCVIPHYPERTFLYATVLPNIIPINDDLYKPIKRNNIKPRVFYSASSKVKRFHTRWNTKAYPEVSKILKRLSRKFNFEYIEVTDKPFNDTLKLKQSADIVIGDISTGSYHLTELEALSQGCAVVSFLDARSVMTLMNVTNSKELPFINVSVDELQPVLKELVKNPELTCEIGNFSRKWIEAHYDDKILIRKFVNFYDDVLNGTIEKAVNSENFEIAKEFLYNRVYDLIWNHKRKVLNSKLENFIDALRNKKFF